MARRNWVQSRVDRDKSRSTVATVMAFVGLFGLIYVCMAYRMVMQTIDPPASDEHDGASSARKSTDAHLSLRARGSTNEEEGKRVLSYNVHAFYYPWYGNPATDGQYWHWNHQLLPHWDPKVAARFPHGVKHDPTKDDLGSSFFPLLGSYSSADPSIIKQHMQMLQQAGIGVAVVSWLPPGKRDDNGPPIASRLGQILDIASEFGIHIAIHMEPYEDRTTESFETDVQDLLQAHGHHPALHRMPRNPHTETDNVADLLPLLYVYDQYHIPGQNWKQILPLRDALVIALIVEEKHWNEFVVQGNFDGGYTYFAANTFTYGSKPHHWRQLQAIATADNKWFIPSVGPGYDDTRVRPWNSQNTKDRGGGTYYDDEWQYALGAHAQVISITSFNEWHEGTQIEPAIPKTIPAAAAAATGSSKGYKYRDYEQEGGKQFYLDKTQQWVKRFIGQDTSSS